MDNVYNSFFRTKSLLRSELIRIIYREKKEYFEKNELININVKIYYIFILNNTHYHLNLYFWNII